MSRDRARTSRHRLRPDGAVRARGGGAARAGGRRREVVDVRTLRPLDGDTILDSVRKTGKAVIVYEDNRFGGYGAEIAAILAEEAFDYLDGPIVRGSGPDVPGVPYNHVLEDWFMPNPERIAEPRGAARRVLRRRVTGATWRGRGPPGADPRSVPRPPRVGHDLQHPDPAAHRREGTRLVRVREARVEARQLLPDADGDLARPARRLLAGAAGAAAGEDGLRLPGGGRGAVRGPRGARRPGVRAIRRPARPGRRSSGPASRPGRRRSSPPPRRSRRARPSSGAATARRRWPAGPSSARASTSRRPPRRRRRPG